MPSVNHSKEMPIQYKGFPTFREWSRAVTDIETWEQTMAGLGEEQCSDILHRIRLIIKDAAFAYRDKTNSLINGTGNALLFKSMCESVISDSNLDTDLALEIQLTVYDYVMDFAISGENISKSWLCRLQSLICGIRQNHAVSKPVYPLHIGKYKHLPNKIARGEKRAIMGAPLKTTSAQMLKYYRELRSKAFLEAHPVLQASYASYALLVIHPFIDGNGRVARLLAFSFLYRSNFVPTLSLNQDRGQYYSVLREANLGNFLPFINLVKESSIESATLIKMRILSAMQQTKILL